MDTTGEALMIIILIIQRISRMSKKSKNSIADLLLTAYFESAPLLLKILLLMIYFLVLEFVAIDKRTLVGNIGLAVALTVCGIYQPWLAKFCGDWKTFNWVIFAQMGVIVIVPFILPESCRWLMGQGEKEKCIKILKKIAKMNKKTVDDRVWTEVEFLCDEQKKERYTSKIELAKIL